MTTATRPTAMGTPRGIAVGRRPEQTARIAGTGLEVWEVYKVFLESERNFDRLTRAFDWLAPEQLDAALVYASEHEEAILNRIREDYAVLPEGERPAI